MPFGYTHGIMTRRCSHLKFIHLRVRRSRRVRGTSHTFCFAVTSDGCANTGIQDANNNIPLTMYDVNQLEVDNGSK